MNTEINYDIKEGNTITISQPSGSALKMYYDGNVLCFENSGYQMCNIFYITKKSELYTSMNNLFKEIKEYDKFHYVKPVRFGNKFEWLSDDVSRNRLVILEDNMGYRITFIKNDNNAYEKKDRCLVRFNLENSNNLTIATLFDKFFTSNFTNLNENKTRKLIIKK